MDECWLKTLKEYVELSRGVHLDTCLVKGRHVYDGKISKLYLKAGYVSARFCLFLSRYEESRHKTGIYETRGCVSRENRVYATYSFGAQRIMIFNFVPGKVEAERSKRYGSGK